MSLAFLPILYFLKVPFTITKQSLKYIASSSILNIAFMVSSFLGLTYGLAGSAGVIITTLSPIMTFVLVAILFKSKLGTSQYLGLLIGLAGGVVILEFHDFSLFLNGSNTYFLLCAIIWAAVTILSQHSQKHIHPIHYSFIISVVATIATFFYAYNSDLLIVFDQGTEFWVSMLFLAIFAQTVATTIFFIASGKLGSEKTSSFMFLVPIFSLISASVILDEQMHLHIIFGGLLSVIAVILINKKTN